MKDFCLLNKFDIVYLQEIKLSAMNDGILRSFGGTYLTD